MKNHFLNTAICAVAVASLAGAAQAAPVTIDDTYWGGVPSTGANEDVIGGTRFAVSNMTVERTIGDDLNVVINTNYANNIGAGQTEIGSLFIGDPAKLANIAGNGSTDTFDADRDRFSYVFDFDVSNSAVTNQTPGGTASLYKLSEDGSDVRQSFGTIFRRFQAVDRTGGTKTEIVGTWAIGAGSITFNIADFFTLAGLPTGLTLAWTMSCANDVILANIPADRLQGPGDEVPLPGAVVLLLSGLAGMGVLGRKRKSSL